MSTTPKPYTLADIEFAGGDHIAVFDTEKLRATVEALDAAQARVKELEGGHLSPGLFAEYGRLDAAWQGLVADRDAATARAEKAEAELAEVRRVLGGDHSFPMSYLAAQVSAEKLGYQRMLKERDEAEKSLTESRAREARMREALEKTHAAMWNERAGKHPEFTEAADRLALAALSTPVSDWLAARDRRVAEAMIHRIEALRSVPLASADFLAGIERVLAMLSGPPTTTAVDAAPLVEFKPEGA